MGNSNTCESPSISQIVSDSKGIVCGIDTKNHTSFYLTNPILRVTRGAVEIHPRDVSPFEREITLAYANSWFPTGTYGTASWLIEGKCRRLVIMWSLPHNRIIYSNWLAVGLTRHGYTNHDDDWFDTMYYRENTNDLKFARKEFYYDTDPAIIRDDGVEVIARMGGHSKSVVSIICQQWG